MYQIINIVLFTAVTGSLKMNTSSSFEISLETLDKSFGEFDVSSESDEQNKCNSKNPVRKAINKLVEVQVKNRMSFNSIHKIIPILNSTPGAAIEIPNYSEFIRSSVSKLFAPVFYANCSKCNELNECPGFCHKCNAALNKNANNTLIYFPIEPQIKQALIKNFDDINKCLDRKQFDDIYEDANDGAIQKTAMEKHLNRKILSLTLNIDGGVVSEKSTRSIWPVQLYQNYMPPRVRFLPENIIVVGLFYGENKPNAFDLLFPLLRDLRNFLQNGIQIMYNGKQYDYLPMLLYSCCDLPARAHLQNFKYSTGFNACPICVHPGHPNKEDRIRVRYAKEIVPSSLRTHSETITHAHKISHGVKGLSCLMAVPEFDIIHSFSTDYMHGSALGVFKRLLSIILGKHAVDTSFKPITKQNQFELNRRIISLKPYSRITYKPRSLADQSTFRAIEYKYSMFFYLRYSLRNLIDHKYVAHFELFSAAVYILCKEKITEAEIKSAEKMLSEFCDLFETYYGISAVTLNVHLLRHYGIIVRQTGPLWCHSLFGFETNMGVLSSYVSGGSRVIEQIAEKYIISKGFDAETSRNQTRKFVFDKNITKKYDQILHQHDGKCKSVTVGKTVFKSLESKSTKSIDYFLEMTDNNIGTALFYVIKNNEVYVLLNVYNIQKRNFHLAEVSRTEKTVLYPFDAINEKLIYLIFGTIEVVSKEPNKNEKS